MVPCKENNILLFLLLFSLPPPSAGASDPSPPTVSFDPTPASEGGFIAQYLISSFGLSPERALKLSTDRNVAAITSEDRPESILRFLKDTGLSDYQIKAVVWLHPRLLDSNVEKTLKPKVRKMKDGGFFGKLLVHLIRYSPGLLLCKTPLSYLLFWKDFVGKDDVASLKIIQRNPWLTSCDVNKFIVPKIKLLNEYGLSNRDIARVLVNGYSCCMTRSLDSFRQILEFIEEFGIPRESGMFLCAFKAVHSHSKDKLEGMVEFFKRTYGWSQEEVYSAFRKYPPVLGCSVGNMKSKMDFLIRKGGFEPRSIASQSALLGRSLERVLIPRYTVLSILKASKPKKKCSLLSACVISERHFRERYVVPYEKDVLGLSEAYAAAYGIKVPV